MAKKPKKMLTIQTKVSIRGAGEFVIGIKIDAAYFQNQWGTRTDDELKELLQQDVESAVTERLKATPLKGELVKAVGQLRARQG